VHQSALAVSVVIPTTGRASLLRAIRSVDEQSVPPSEIIVANDSGQELTLPPTTVPLRLVSTAGHEGGNAARMAGVWDATSDLVAFLDDDDEWDRGYLASAAALIGREGLTGDGRWVITGRVIAPNGRVFPDRLLRDTDPLLDYLFYLKGGVRTKGAMATSTMITPRRLATETPWNTVQRFHQDQDWLLDLEVSGIPVRYYQLTDTAVRIYDTPDSITKGIPVDSSVAWARRRLLEDPRTHDRRAFAEYLLTRYPLPHAVDIGHWREAFGVVRTAARDGRPGLWAFAFAFAYMARGAVRRRRGRR
jgi:glycosyltransferase involved in cell wall biosynthesis